MSHDHDGHEDSSTLRLLMPQWQGGGYNPAYPLGAQLLAWLAPPSTAAFEEVPISRSDEGLIVDQAMILSDMLRRLPIVGGSER
jgi:arginase